MQEFITWTIDGPQVPLAESKLSKSNGILVMVNNQVDFYKLLVIINIKKNISCQEITQLCAEPLFLTRRMSTINLRLSSAVVLSGPRGWRRCVGVLVDNSVSVLCFPFFQTNNFEINVHNYLWPPPIHRCSQRLP